MPRTLLADSNLRVYRSPHLSNASSQTRGGGAPQVAVWFPGNGITYFSLNSGWGEKPVKNWAIEASDLARLREAAKTLGYKIKPSDSTPSAKRKGARRPKNEPPEFRRQLHMFDKGAS